MTRPEGMPNAKFTLWDLLQEPFMPLRISGKNLDIGEALRQHVNEKLETATSKYFDGTVTGHVVITPDGSGYYAACTLHLASGVTLQAEARAHEPYASLDQAAERIEKQLGRHRRRHKDNHPLAGE